MSQTTTVHDNFLAGIISEETLEREGVKAILKEHGVHQRIFGEMIKLATPMIEHYHGDLYHDVHWLDEYLTDLETEFYFGFDNCGTAIGTDYDLIRLSRQSNVYKFTLYEQGRSFYLKIERIEDGR